MADVRPVAPALLIIVVFSRHDDLHRRVCEDLQRHFGPIELASEPFLFNQTAYYAKTMGEHLQKRLLAFKHLIDPERLVELKLTTNALERSYADSGEYPETRPVNIDPGYLILGKFLLATTKDQAHRVYLREGIYAEVTLHYHAGLWEPWPWTYADYRQSEVLAFLGQAREYYRREVAVHRQTSPARSPSHEPA
jgi:hypothetical protein